MPSFPDKTIGEIVTEDYRWATVLKGYDIDFCCGGGQTLEAACRSRGLDIGEMQRRIAHLDNRFVDAYMRPASWPLDFLTDYIERVHHAFLRELLPLLIQFSGKVAGIHAHQDEALYEIDELLRQLDSMLTHRIQQEEDMIFPQVRRSEAGASDQARGSELLLQLIHDFGDQHGHLGMMMRRMRELTDDFQAPEHACNTYRALYAGLHLLDRDLRWHIHLENNILFPRVVEMENRLRPAVAAMSAGV